MADTPPMRPPAKVLRILGPKDDGAWERALVGIYDALDQVGSAMFRSYTTLQFPIGNVAAYTTIRNSLSGLDAPQRRILKFTDAAITATDDPIGLLTNVTIPVFAAASNGLAPLSGGGNTNFLRADGAWIAPPTGAGGITQLTGDGLAGPGSGSQVFTHVNSPSGVTHAGTIVTTAIAAPGTPAAGKATQYVDSTSKNFASRDDTGAINHGVRTQAAVASNWIRAIADNGSLTISQPAFTDISGTLAGSQFGPLTGDVTTSGYAATIAANAVSDTKLRQSAALSVVGRSANSTGNVADISATAATGAVLRESGSVIGWGTIATGGLGANVVTNPKLAQMPALTIKGNNAGSPADPVDMTGAQTNVFLPVFTSALNGLAPGSGGGTTNFLRADGTWQPPPSAGGGITQLTGDVTAGPGSGSQVATLVNIPSATTAAGSIVFTAISVPGTPAAGKATLYVDSTSKNHASKDDAGIVNHGVRTKAAVANQWLTSIADDGTSVLAQPAFTNISGTLGSAQFGPLTGDVTTSGYAATIATNVVGDTKLRQGVARSVIGRSAGSTGNVADIAAGSGSAFVLRESGGTIDWGQVATGGIATAAVTYAKIQNMSADRLLGRGNGGGAGVPQEIAIGTNLSMAGTTLNATTAISASFGGKLDGSVDADSSSLFPSVTGSDLDAVFQARGTTTRARLMVYIGSNGISGGDQIDFAIYASGGSTGTLFSMFSFSTGALDSGDVALTINSGDRFVGECSMPSGSAAMTFYWTLYLYNP